MILEFIIGLIIDIVTFIFSILPNLPGFDSTILSSLNNFINMIFNNLGLLGFFIHINTIKTLIPLVILVVNFDKVYHFAMWVVRKLPINIS